MKAQIKNHNGTPTLFLNDQPAFAGCQLLGYIPLDNPSITQASIGAFSKANVHIYSIDSITTEWCGPRPDNPSHYDFSDTAPRLQAVLDIDPDALFLLRMSFETRGLKNDWWNRMYPDELEVLSDGTTIAQSFASTVWQSQVKDFLKAYIDHLRSTGMYDRVIAYQVATGTCGEWIKYWSSMNTLCGDYSEPMRRYFRAWLKHHYNGDNAALQKAWADPQVSFDTAEVPPAADQFKTTHFQFRDPRSEQKVIDFYDCYAELCADVMISLCHTVKEETDGEKLAGAFFGYLMELAWNDCFFVDNYDKQEGCWVSTIQRSGHLGLKKALRSPDVDFFVSPYGYAFRGVGGDGLPMQPSEAMRLHGKIYLYEEDSLMHNYYDPGGRMQPVENSIAVYQRNFAQVVTHGEGITWLENDVFVEDPRILGDARYWIRRFQELGIWALQLNRKPSAEVAVFLDDESFWYESIRNNIDIPLIWQQRVVNLNRFGAPHDVYLLNDLLEEELPSYKLYIFLNPFHLNYERRAKLKSIIRRDNKVALWLYAPGYINSDVVDTTDANGSPLHTDHMTDLTGFHFGKGLGHWGPFMNITNFNHPITRGLPQDFFWGTTNPIGPLFHLEDPEAITLGQVVYFLGRCKPGFGVKTFGSGTGESSWTSVYIATPNVPAPLLRGIARYAGVHLYNEDGDVLYATPELLSIHTVAGGPRTFNLPRRVEAVFDLFNGCMIAQNTAQINVVLPPASTSLYFTGKADLLASLKS